MAANDPLATLLAGQAEILAELAALREEVRGLRVSRDRAPTLRASDREALSRILPVLAGIFGPGRFAAWEVLDLAAGRGADGANLRLVLGGRSAHDLGRLLARGAGADLACGVRVERDGRDRDGGLWRCVVVASSLPRSAPGAETRAINNTQEPDR